VWDCQTGQAAGSPLLGHTERIWSVCTDGRLIISGQSDKTIRIWDLTSRTQIGSPIDAGGYVYAVALSNDGRIAAGVENAVCVWDVKTRRRIASMKGHTSAVWAVAFSPDNSRIASGSDDKSIRLWDTQTYTQIGNSPGIQAVWSVSFSPDGRWITSGSDDKTVRVWHCNTGQLIDPPLQGHTDAVKSVAFSPDGCQLISGSRDKLFASGPNSKSKEWPQAVRANHHHTPLTTHCPSLTAYDPHSKATLPSSLPVTLLIAPSMQHPHLTDMYPSGTLPTTSYGSQTHLFIPSISSDCPRSAYYIVSRWLCVGLGHGRRKTDTSNSHYIWTTAQYDEYPSIQTAKQLIHRNPIVRWIPFKVDAGLWAYVDGTFIRPCRFLTQSRFSVLCTTGNLDVLFM
jgi:WD40 repeat protein